jgi:hypothetical protein
MLLGSFRDLNDGAGPVVPKWMADEFEKMGISTGYVEERQLPKMAQPRPASAT